ncbi:MAG: ATP-binding cassette domain-containing protein [Kiritimatiellae bacterium]|nr:ATP-binding cassette domain-containing protein [Kiritimatiellia bacterium]
MILNISNLTVYLQGRCILQNVALDINRGEFVAVLGDNGAGKTTLLRSILGLVPGTSGIICIFGQIVSWHTRQALRRRIGYVPQILPFDASMPMSVREVIAIGRSARVGLGRRLGSNDWRLVEQAAADTELAQLLDRPIGQLSGGERQKVQIARALCQQPDLLLLDEPASHLDPAAHQDCLKLLDRLHLQYHPPILMVTHNVSAIPVNCRRAIVLEAGRIRFDGSLNEWRCSGFPLSRE